MTDFKLIEPHVTAARFSQLQQEQNQKNQENGTDIRLFATEVAFHQYDVYSSPFPIYL